MIDPRKIQREKIQEAQDRIDALKEKWPTNYKKHPEYFKLMATIRVAEGRIRHFQDMMERGVRF